MAVKIVRILIVVPVLLFLVFYGFDALIKRLESKKNDEETQHRILRQQILENAKANIKVMKWAENEVSPQKIKVLEKQHGRNIEVAAIHHKMDPKLIKAIVLTESSGNTTAVSPRKAIGLMGVKAAAAKDVEAHPKYLKDPFYNLLIGAKYFGTLKTRYGCVYLEDCLLAYNRGTSAAKAMLKAGYRLADDPYIQKIFLVMDKIN